MMMFLRRVPTYHRVSNLCWLPGGVKLATAFLRVSSFSQSLRDSSSLSTRDEEAQCPRAFAEMPGPRPLPLIGNLWRYFPLVGCYRLSTLKENGQYNLAHYGKIVREEITATHRIVHLFDPRDFESLFAQEGRYPCRRSHRALIRYRRERPDQYRSGGIFPENGAEWARVRNVFKKHFLIATNVNKYDVALDKVVNDLVEYVRQTRNQNTLEVIDFQEDLYRWAVESICAIMLDSRLGCLEHTAQHDPSTDANRLVQAAHKTIYAVMKTELYSGWETRDTKDYRLLVWAQDEMASVTQTYLQRRIEEVESGRDPQPDTLLAQFIRDPKVDRKDLFAMILDMVLAGIDTTSISSGFTFYHLAMHPDIQEEVRREVCSVVARRETIRAFHFAQMPLLRACIKESMRITPVSIGVGRLTTGPITLGGYNIPPDTMVITQNQVSCLQEEYYPEATKFKPSRWLTGTRDRSVNRFLWLPFGHGPRMCLGRRFAELEQNLLIAKMLQHFRVEYHHEPIGVKAMLINVPDRVMRFRFVDL